MAVRKRKSRAHMPKANVFRVNSEPHKSGNDRKAWHCLLHFTILCRAHRRFGGLLEYVLTRIGEDHGYSLFSNILKSKKLF